MSSTVTTHPSAIILRPVNRRAAKGYLRKGMTSTTPNRSSSAISIQRQQQFGVTYTESAASAYATSNPFRQMLVLETEDLQIGAPLIQVGRQFVEFADESGERYYLILGGLQEGERIVSGANFLIDAEAQVQGR